MGPDDRQGPFRRGQGRRPGYLHRRGVRPARHHCRVAEHPKQETRRASAFGRFLRCREVLRDQCGPHRGESLAGIVNLLADIEGISHPLPLHATVAVLDDGAVRVLAQTIVDREQLGVSGNLLGMVGATTHLWPSAVANRSSKGVPPCASDCSISAAMLAAGAVGGSSTGGGWHGGGWHDGGWRGGPGWGPWFHPGACPGRQPITERCPRGWWPRTPPPPVRVHELFGARRLATLVMSQDIR